MKITVKTAALLALYNFCLVDRWNHPCACLHLRKTPTGSIVLAATDARAIIMTRLGICPEGFTDDRTIPSELVGAFKRASLFAEAVDIEFTEDKVSIICGSLVFSTKHQWTDCRIDWPKIIGELVGEPRDPAHIQPDEVQLNSWLTLRIMSAWKLLREDDEGEPKQLIIKRSGIGWAFREFPGADFCAIAMPFRQRYPEDLAPLPEWAMLPISPKAEDPAS